MQVYLVGGAVRDKLLGYPVYDRDWVVVGASPDIMLQQASGPSARTSPYLSTKTAVKNTRWPAQNVNPARGTPAFSIMPARMSPLKRTYCAAT